MPPEESTVETAAGIPPVAAPRRAKRLSPVEPPPRRRPAAAAVPKQGVPVRPKEVPAIESKLAALHDPHEILNLVRTEAVLRRAQRLSGQGDAQRQMIRVLSVCMLFALLAAAIGAMWYLQTSLQGSRRARRPSAALDAGAPVPADRRAPASR